MSRAAPVLEHLTCLLRKLGLELEALVTAGPACYDIEIGDFVMAMMGNSSVMGGSDGYGWF